ncbi:centriolar and ciliogenesis-associated protein HYSL1 [Pangasianodon hypophthalmus]|uniref:centriolar and ciliogenesis-associated protein HYSL1 n=1 Tax=Pangasianodon hypophthalmus TaxID=310915 RepID=UPI000EFF29F2|nr:centriolar and ciliogenesis-associated protein HYSL1 [Pangasianodon hypophthalmus]XP_034164848.1 centriolar and ciliogenesis-associated protein HYSL1 [Pangasianodon hypophthalmus]
MENLDFSEEEIQEQLAVLGYTNITKQRLRDFKRDLDLLIHHEKSKSSTSAEWSSPKSHSSSCKSPPAFTKEKVQVPSAASKYNYIYSGNRAADQHRQVLTSTFNDENCDTVNLGHGDSYIKHSVAPGCIRPSTAPNRLEVEDTSSDIYHSVLSASEPERPQRDLHANAKPALKRKVLRKHRGHSQVCDESTYSEDSEPVSELEERLEQLRVSAPHRRHELYSESEETSSYSDRHSSATDELPSAFQAYIKGMTRSRSENDIRPRPKSFIRPVMDHPHTRNLKKTDPVAKYFQYKQDWEMFKPPGEKRRKELHLAIREQLAYQPPPPKPQRTYVPNAYVVPTEKKRSALRWEIRHDLANGIIPAKVTYT